MIQSKIKKEICEYLQLTSPSYAIKKYVMPLIEEGKIKMSIPEKLKSQKQLYYSV